MDLVLSHVTPPIAHGGDGAAFGQGRSLGADSSGRPAGVGEWAAVDTFSLSFLVFVRFFFPLPLSFPPLVHYPSSYCIFSVSVLSFSPYLSLFPFSLYLTPSPLSSLPRSAPLRLLFPVSPSNLSSPPPSPADCTGEPQRRTSGFNSVPISKDQVLGGRKVIGPDTPRSASFFWLAAPLRSSSLIFLLLCSFIIIIFNCLFDSFSFAGKVPSLSFYPLFYFIQD